jgi:hypothetical protein
MVNMGFEHVNYFCPRKRILCSLSLSVQYNFKEGKIYSSIDCDEKQNCRVGNPDKISHFNWEICSAYHQYVQ